MTRKYYIVEKFRRKGPFNIVELEKQGITEETMIWTFELSDPVKIVDLPELSSLLKPVEKKDEEKNPTTKLSDEELLKQYEEIKKQEEQNKEKQNEQTILLETGNNKEPEEQVIETKQKEVIPPIIQTGEKDNKKDKLNKEPEEHIFDDSEKEDKDISFQEISKDSILTPQKIENKEYTAHTDQEATFGLKDRPPKPKNYVIWSVLVLIFCCNPIAIGSLIIGAQVENKYNSEDYIGAEKASKTALTLIIISVVITVLGIITLVLAENM